MSAYQSRIHQVLPPLTSLMGLLALGGGIYGLTNPLAWSGTLGLPAPTPSAPILPFVSFVAARNIGTGVTGLVLLYTGQRKAAGTGMMCGVVTCLTDAFICWKFGDPDGKAVGHAFMGLVAAALGTGLIWAKS